MFQEDAFRRPEGDVLLLKQRAEGPNQVLEIHVLPPQNTLTGQTFKHIDTTANPEASLLQPGAFWAPLTPEEEGRGKEKTSWRWGCGASLGVQKGFFFAVTEVGLVGSAHTEHTTNLKSDPSQAPHSKSILGSQEALGTQTMALRC